MKEAHDFIVSGAKLKEVHETKPKKVERSSWLSQAFPADNRINKDFSATSQDFAVVYSKPASVAQVKIGDKPSLEQVRLLAATPSGVSLRDLPYKTCISPMVFCTAWFVPCVLKAHLSITLG